VRGNVRGNRRGNRRGNTGRKETCCWEMAVVIQPENKERHHA